MEGNWKSVTVFHHFSELKKCINAGSIFCTTLTLRVKYKKVVANNSHQQPSQDSLRLAINMCEHLCNVLAILRHKNTFLPAFLREKTD